IRRQDAGGLLRPRARNPDTAVEHPARHQEQAADSKGSASHDPGTRLVIAYLVLTVHVTVCSGEHDLTGSFCTRRCFVAKPLSTPNGISGGSAHNDVLTVSPLRVRFPIVGGRRGLARRRSSSRREIPCLPSPARLRRQCIRFLSCSGNECIVGANALVTEGKE